MTKQALAPIVRGRVRLRLLEESDLPMTLAWRNQDDIRKWFFFSDVISPEQHQAWWQRYRDRDDDFVFIIEETETLRRPVGQIALYNVDWVAGRAEFGRLMLGDDLARGQGLARLATTALVEEGFNLGLREIYLEVLASNRSAIQVYRAAGFTESASQADRITMRRYADASSTQSPA